ncbi:hypothetical protein EC973_008724 [Apophysomyces ossiformis]|uniref:Sulfotransferase domain-containing protein n=1 Tax=Apophysomyces ossiformis TaxID=679940 RepID=A0A8H7BSE4_9FUNG|nr:hypothetical protein EC973_008724 [Apophysomyces ossiformis]
MSLDTDESVLAPMTSRRIAFKWRASLTQRYEMDRVGHPKRSELSGTSYAFRTLSQHPQVLQLKKHPEFDLEAFDDATAFESYLAQFPSLPEDMLEQKEMIVGEHAPHYLYHSYRTARRLRETLPHVKLVFILRDPIDRAYAQYYQQGSNSSLSFERQVDLEISMIRQCGHTSYQSGWEGFVQCLKSHEIRVSWNMTDQTHGKLSEKRTLDSLARGMYLPALLPFLQNFPSSQLFVMRTEDFLDNPSASLQRLARFLGIDETFFSERNFYQDELTEDELLSDGLHRRPKPQPHRRPGDLYSHHAKLRHSRVTSMMMEDADNIPDNEERSDANKTEPPSLELSIRYRLQKVFGQINTRLTELFENANDFKQWEYDVDQG